MSSLSTRIRNTSLISGIMQTSQLDESGSSSSGQQLFFYMPHLLLGQSSLSQEFQKTENGLIKTQTQGTLKRRLPFPAQEEDNKKILKYTSPLQEDIFPDYNLQFLSKIEEESIINLEIIFSLETLVSICHCYENIKMKSSYIGWNQNSCISSLPSLSPQLMEAMNRSTHYFFNNEKINIKKMIHFYRLFPFWRSQRNEKISGYFNAFLYVSNIFLKENEYLDLCNQEVFDICLIINEIINLPVEYLKKLNAKKIIRFINLFNEKIIHENILKKMNKDDLLKFFKLSLDLSYLGNKLSDELFNDDNFSVQLNELAKTLGKKIGQSSDVIFRSQDLVEICVTIKYRIERISENWLSFFIPRLQNSAARFLIEVIAEKIERSAPVYLNNDQIIKAFESFYDLSDAIPADQKFIQSIAGKLKGNTSIQKRFQTFEMIRIVWAFQYMSGQSEGSKRLVQVATELIRHTEAVGLDSSGIDSICQGLMGLSENSPEAASLVKVCIHIIKKNLPEQIDTEEEFSHIFKFVKKFSKGVPEFQALVSILKKMIQNSDFSYLLDAVDNFGRDLEGYDLSNLNVSGSDFTVTGANAGQLYVNLSNSICRGINCTKTNLSNVVADNADFTKANFSFAILKNTSLKGANCKDINLSFITISPQTNFTGAIFEGNEIISIQLPNSSDHLDSNSSSSTDDDYVRPVELSEQYLDRNFNHKLNRKSILTAVHTISNSKVRIRAMESIIAWVEKLPLQKKNDVLKYWESFSSILFKKSGDYTSSSVISKFILNELADKIISAGNTQKKLFNKVEAKFFFSLVKEKNKNFYLTNSLFISQLIYSMKTHKLNPIVQNGIQLERIYLSFFPSIYSEAKSMLQRLARVSESLPSKIDLDRNMVLIAPNGKNFLLISFEYYQRFMLDKDVGSIINWDNLCYFKEINQDNYIIQPNGAVDLMEIFNEIPLFKKQYEFYSSCNSMMNFINVLKLGEHQELFLKTFHKKSSKIKFVDLENYEKLKRVFTPFFKSLVVSMRHVELKDEFIQRISEIFKFDQLSGNPSEIAATYASLAAFFVFLSSSTVFGTDDDSPEIIRQFAVGFLNQAKIFLPDLIDLDWIDTLVGSSQSAQVDSVAVFSCTGSLFLEMKEKLENTNAFRSIIPIAWQ